MSVTKLTAKLLQKYLARTKVPHKDLPNFIRNVHQLLDTLATGEKTTTASPAIIQTVADQAPPSPPPNQTTVEAESVPPVSPTPSQTTATPQPAATNGIPTASKPEHPIAPPNPIFRPMAIPVMAVPIEQAVSDHAVVCLACGYTGKFLKAHLHTKHNLSVEMYRKRFGLAEDFPLVAPSYAEERRNEVLGRRKVRSVKPL